MDSKREEGEAAFRLALETLRPKLDAVTKRLRSYEAGCRSGTQAVRPPGCESAGQELRSLLDEIDRVVEAAEEEARRSWVSPGARRSLLRQHQLEPSSLDRLRGDVEAAMR
jgi:hypothetical protein